MEVINEQEINLELHQIWKNATSKYIVDLIVNDVVCYNHDNGTHILNEMCSVHQFKGLIATHNLVLSKKVDIEVNDCWRGAGNEIRVLDVDDVSVTYKQIVEALTHPIQSIVRRDDFLKYCEVLNLTR